MKTTFIEQAGVRFAIEEERPPQIAEYTIVRAADNNTLANIVNGSIQQGWQPCGGLAISDHYLYQVMVKYA